MLTMKYKAVTLSLLLLCVTLSFQHVIQGGYTGSSSFSASHASSSAFSSSSSSSFSGSSSFGGSSGKHGLHTNEVGGIVNAPGVLVGIYPGTHSFSGSKSSGYSGAGSGSSTFVGSVSGPGTHGSVESGPGSSSTDNTGYGGTASRSGAGGINTGTPDSNTGTNSYTEVVGGVNGVHGGAGDVTGLVAVKEPDALPLGVPIASSNLEYGKPGESGSGSLPSSGVFNGNAGLTQRTQITLDSRGGPHIPVDRDTNRDRLPEPGSGVSSGNSGVAGSFGSSVIDGSISTGQQLGYGDSPKNEASGVYNGGINTGVIDDKYLNSGISNSGANSGALAVSGGIGSLPNTGNNGNYKWTTTPVPLAEKTAGIIEEASHGPVIAGTGTHRENAPAVDRKGVNYGIDDSKHVSVAPVGSDAYNGYLSQSEVGTNAQNGGNPEGIGPYEQKNPSGVPEVFTRTGISPTETDREHLDVPYVGGKGTNNGVGSVNLPGSGIYSGSTNVPGLNNNGPSNVYKQSNGVQVGVGGIAGENNRDHDGSTHGFSGSGFSGSGFSDVSGNYKGTLSVVKNKGNAENTPYFSGPDRIDTSSHYEGPFPGPDGSIHDSKPASTHVQASFGNVASSGSSNIGGHYDGPFPRPDGRVHENKVFSQSTYPGPISGPSSSTHDSQPTFAGSVGIGSASASCGLCNVANSGPNTAYNQGLKDNHEHSIDLQSRNHPSEIGIVVSKPPVYIPPGLIGGALRGSGLISGHTISTYPGHISLGIHKAVIKGSLPTEHIQSYATPNFGGKSTVSGAYSNAKSESSSGSFSGSYGSSEPVPAIKIENYPGGFRSGSDTTGGSYGGVKGGPLSGSFASSGSAAGSGAFRGLASGSFAHSSSFASSSSGSHY